MLFKKDTHAKNELNTAATIAAIAAEKHRIVSGTLGAESAAVLKKRGSCGW